MKANVYAEDMDGNRRYIDTVIYDSTARAIQMYEDEADEDEQIILVDIDD